MNVKQKADNIIILNTYHLLCDLETIIHKVNKGI